MLPIIGPEMIQEFMAKLERDGKSKDYIDGMLEGLSFVFEFYYGTVKVSTEKKRLIEEEFNVPTEVTS